MLIKTSLPICDRVASIAQLTVVASLLFSCAPSAPAAATRHVNLSTKAGVTWQFTPEGISSWKPIVVPGGGWRAQGYTCDAGKYRTTVTIPASVAGQDIQLTFAAINFGATILVGPSAGNLTQVASHVDGWVPVTADITRYAVPGRPLVVEVDVLGRKKFMVKGKYTVPEGATWDPYIEEGILRGVSLNILPTVHVDDAVVITKIGPDTVSAAVRVTNSGDATRVVALNARVVSTGGESTSLRWPAQSVTLAAGETRLIQLPVMNWGLGKASYWWPNVPYRPKYQAKMFALTVDLHPDVGASHHYDQPFGFRQFAALGNHYYLNGIQCNLRGDNLQEANFGVDAYGIRPGFGPPTPGNGGWPEAVNNLQRLNFNVMRIHQIPATPYMLDVCDQKGLMLVDESPLRGSEGGEDYQDGKVNMLNMDRELVLRDRDHPSVIIWSAANEWSEPIADAVPVILAVDSTRPIIGDGAGNAAPAIDTQHYVSGFGVLPTTGATQRSDRPYGETEDIWPADNTLRGFAWMGTGIRLRRLNGDADLRNYTLNNAWPNFVPGESPANEILETKIKGNIGATILPSITNPWTNPNIQLIQNCYNPVAVADVDFDATNAKSDLNGDWPVKSLNILTGSQVTRTIAVFNDEFSGNTVNLAWQARLDAPTGAILASGATNYAILLGQFRKVTIHFNAPNQDGRKVYLLLTTSKSGQIRCREKQISFVTGPANAQGLPVGEYGIVNERSGLYLGISADGKSLVQQAHVSDRQIWTVAFQGPNTIVLTNKATGQTIQTGSGQTNNGDPVLVGLPTGGPEQTWTLGTDMGEYTLTNPSSGRVMDDLGQSLAEGAPVVVYDLNSGLNQFWEFTPAGMR